MKIIPHFERRSISYDFESKFSARYKVGVCTNEGNGNLRSFTCCSCVKSVCKLRFGSRSAKSRLMLPKKAEFCTTFSGNLDYAFVIKTSE